MNCPKFLVLGALLRIFSLPNEASYSTGSWVMIMDIQTFSSHDYTAQDMATSIYICIYIHFYK